MGLGETMSEDISKREKEIPWHAGRPRDDYTTSKPIKTPGVLIQY